MTRRALWLGLAVPGLVQLALLLWAMAHRVAFPYDLEWMEGGMLAHAQRLLDGHSIYPPPSIDFIPYLYTPLYPALLAVLSKAFGLSYVLGRGVAVASTLCTLVLMVVAIAKVAPARRGLTFVGAALALGLFAACYPWFEGWYDVVRGDMLALAIGLGGLYALRQWAPRRTGLWHPEVALAAAIIALSFFAKQTGVLLVVAGGAALLFMNWRAIPSYVVSAGLVGGGGTLVLNQLTDGWFWIYIYRVHQSHDTNRDRFFKSFANIFSHFPVLTLVVVATLVGLGAIALRRRRLPEGSGAFLYWTWMFAVGSVVGALGWATQWAHFNAYIPAMTFGAIAAGAAVPLAPALGEALLDESFTLPATAAMVLGLGAQLAISGWSPAPLIPSDKERAAGDALIARIAATPGEVFIPSHPWYAHLAGKPIFTHRMGILDVTVPPQPGKQPLPPRAQDVEGLERDLRAGRFAAVILDDRQPESELPGLINGYRPDATLPPAESPHVVTGARTVPRTVWVPIQPDVPAPGTRVLFDFEGDSYKGWEVTGTAWGRGPVKSLAGKEVGGYRGQRFATSYAAGGDAPVGTIVSPPFTLAGKKLTLRVGGGDDAKKVRVELRLAADGKVLRSATGKKSLMLTLVSWDVAELDGQSVRLALVDEGTGSWGGLIVDDVREVELP